MSWSPDDAKWDARAAHQESGGGFHRGCGGCVYLVRLDAGAREYQCENCGDDVAPSEVCDDPDEALTDDGEEVQE